MKEELPKAIHTDTLKILGMELEVSVLEDGQRIISKDSFERFMAILENHDMSEDEAKEVAKIIRG